MKDELMLLGILSLYFLSLLSVIGFSFISGFIPFFFLILLGSSLYFFDSPREWYFLGGLAFFGYLLSFTPRRPGNFTLAYLGLFLVFFISLLVLRPRQIAGRVLLSSPEWAVVQIEGNILVGIPKGIYASKSKKGIRKGDKVLLEVKRKWGEREELRILRKL